MEESTQTSSRTAGYSAQQQTAVEQALYRLHEAGLIVLEPYHKEVSGYDVSILPLLRMESDHTSPPSK